MLLILGFWHKYSQRCIQASEFALHCANEYVKEREKNATIINKLNIVGLQAIPYFIRYLYNKLFEHYGFM